MPSPPVWFLNNGQSTGSAVLVWVRPIGGGTAEQRLLTAQHVLRLNDQLNGPYSQTLKVWPPDVGYNDATAIPVTVDTILSPDPSLPLQHPEDLAFLSLPSGATGSSPSGLLPFGECVAGLGGLDIFGYVSGDDLITVQKGVVRPAPYSAWTYDFLDATSGIGTLVPGQGAPAGGVSGGGVFLKDRCAGIYRGEFQNIGQHLFLPLTRVRDWLFAKGWELVDQSVSGRVAAITTGIDAVDKLKAAGDVRALLNANQQQINELKEALVDFAFCKQLHDVLHGIHLAFQDVSMSLTMRELSAFRFKIFVQTVELRLQEIDDIFAKTAATAMLQNREAVWVDSLKKSFRVAQGSLFSDDVAIAFCDELQSILQRNLPSINMQLVGLARAMKLQQLSQLFGTISQMKVVSAQQKDECLRSQEACLTLRADLLDNVETHNRWQEMDDKLWLAHSPPCLLWLRMRRGR
jgi:hypothetical protein